GRTIRKDESVPAAGIEICLPAGDVSASIGREKVFLLEHRIDLELFSDWQKPMVRHDQHVCRATRAAVAERLQQHGDVTVDALERRKRLGRTRTVGVLDAVEIGEVHHRQVRLICAKDEGSHVEPVRIRLSRRERLAACDFDGVDQMWSGYRAKKLKALRM